MKGTQMNKVERQTEIAKVYAKLSKDTGKYPSHAGLLKAGVDRNRIRYDFGDTDALKTFARDAFPEAFKKIIDPDFYNSESFSELKAEVKKYKRFVIATAVAGAPVDEDLYDSIKTYCRLRKALLLILPANYALYDLPVDLVAAERVVFRDLKLNSNVMVSAIKIDPKQFDPSTSLSDLGDHEGTVIIGSPKQRRVPIANGATAMAHIIQATGAITKPRYFPKDKEPKRRDTIATKQHVMGFVVVEIVSDRLFHCRQVEANRDGSFNDVFVNYDGEGSRPAPVAAIVEGDRHNGETDPQSDKVTDELCKIGRPAVRVWHDFFDGKSINHHEKKDQVRRAQHAATGDLSLSKELNALAITLKAKLALNTCGGIHIVPSNHDAFLSRYVSEGDFSDDYNRLTSVKLQAMAIEGKNPIQAWLKEVCGLNDAKVTWGDLDEDIKVTKKKIEINAHGHLGANGRRNPGSNGMRKAFGNVIYGHCHYGEINHGAMSVGTGAKKQDYEKGPSSHGVTHGIVYADGTRQLINVIQGQWRLKD